MDPQTIGFLSGLGLLALALWALSRKQARPALPYTRRTGLLTPGELRFYGVLRAAMPRGLAVFPKVRLMDLVAVPDQVWGRYGAPGSGMHVDFVLADATTTEPRLVIELDDRSHERPEVRERDAFKDAALGAAGLPLVRVPVGRYDVAALSARIAAALR